MLIYHGYLMISPPLFSWSIVILDLKKSLGPPNGFNSSWYRIISATFCGSLMIPAVVVDDEPVVTGIEWGLNWGIWQFLVLIIS